MAHGSRRWTGAIGFALAALALLLAFRWLAAGLAAHELRQQAAEVTRDIETGHAVWRWVLRQPHDLVAGRAFGQAGVQATPIGLRVTSQDGTPFELGLPIATGLDLAHWPVLALHWPDGPPAALSVVWQAADGPACLATAAANGQHRRARIDLRTLDWRPSGPGTCVLSSSARMLRLRLTLPAGHAITLDTVALVRPGAKVDGIDDALPRIDPDRLAAWLAHLARSTQASPVVRLPPDVSAERMLAIRDAVAGVRPAARLLVGDTALPATPSAELPRGWGWAACAIYVVLLGGVARSGRRPAGPVLALAWLGPLWLIAGLQWGLRASLPGGLACTAALAFAGYIEWTERPVDWQWLGRWRRPQTWWPLLLLPVALVLGLRFGHAMEPVSVRRAVIYLAWAALQQWLILGFGLSRLERLLPWRPPAILLAATVFALMHTPNGALMQLCFIAELWLGWCFLRSRALLPLAVVHAASALFLGATLVGGPLRSLEVSARFFL